MTIDTRKTIRIEGSSIKMLGLFAMSLLLTALCLWAGLSPDNAEPLLTWLGVALFGLCGAYAFWRMIQPPKTMLTITPDGIHHIHWPYCILWPSIVEVYIYRTKGVRIIMLPLHPELDAQIHRTVARQAIRLVGHTLDLEGAGVTASGLSIGFKELHAIIEAYWQAYGGRPPDDAAPYMSIPSGALPPELIQK